MIAKVEHYFLAEDRADISLADRIYFYGFYLVSAVVFIALVGKVGF